MKKITQVILFLLLLLLLLLSLFGCDTGNTKVSAATASPQPTIQYVEPKEEPVPTNDALDEVEPYTIGFTILGEEVAFFKNVKESTYEAAKENDIKLLYEVNDRDPIKMHEIINSFVAQGADMIVDFTVLPDEGNKIASELKNKGIPMLSIDCLYNDAYFFGINNLDAGKTVGRFLASEIDDRWNGQVDAMLMLYAEANGEIVKQRVSGAYNGLVESGIDISEDQLTYININTPTNKLTDIDYVTSLVAEYMEDHPDTHIGVVAATDDIALGALAAIDKANRMDDVLMVSHNCDPTAIANFKRGDNCWIGSVNYASTSYGEQIISICTDILNGVEYNKEIYNYAYVVSIYNVHEYFPD